MLRYDVFLIVGVAAHREFVCSTLCTRWCYLFICKLLTGTNKPVSQFKRRRSIRILVAVFLQHNINSVMYGKDEASDSLNKKLERQSRAEFVNNCES